MVYLRVSATKALQYVRRLTRFISPISSSSHCPCNLIALNLHSLQRAKMACQLERTLMNTTNPIRLAALTISIAITALLQGTMLWSFDTVAQQADQQSAIQMTTAAAACQKS
jgi:hypothetical protein